MNDRTAEIAAAFDRRAAGYRHSDWHRRSAQRLVDLCRLRPGDRVLDTGTGTGFAALHAAALVGSHGRVVGVDISPGMLAEARADAAASGHTHVEFVSGDATRLAGFADATFDTVTCATALLYIPVDEGLREWHRVLRAGGVIAFSAMASGYPRGAVLFRACAADFGVALDDPCAPLGSIDACRRALERAGFAVEAVLTETIEFSPRDLERAWESNLWSASHERVRELAEADLQALEARYREAVAAEARVDPRGLLRSEMLYALGRR